MPAEPSGDVLLRLADLGLALPPRPTPIANFLPYRVVAPLVFLAGQTCEVGGVMRFCGQVGIDLDVPAAQQAARLCALNLLAALYEACEQDFGRVAGCVRVGGFVQAPSGFGQVPAVIDGASDLFVALWGDDGRHARTAVGVATLPQNAAVEVEAIFRLRGDG